MRGSVGPAGKSSSRREPHFDPKEPPARRRHRHAVIDERMRGELQRSARHTVSSDRVCIVIPGDDKTRIRRQTSSHAGIVPMIRRPRGIHIVRPEPYLPDSSNKLPDLAPRKHHRQRRMALDADLTPACPVLPPEVIPEKDAQRTDRLIDRAALASLLLHMMEKVALRPACRVKRRQHPCAVRCAAPSSNRNPGCAAGGN